MRLLELDEVYKDAVTVVLGWKGLTKAAVVLAGSDDTQVHTYWGMAILLWCVCVRRYLVRTVTG